MSTVNRRAVVGSKLVVADVQNHLSLWFFRIEALFCMFEISNINKTWYWKFNFHKFVWKIFSEPQLANQQDSNNTKHIFNIFQFGPFTFIPVDSFFFKCKIKKGYTFKFNQSCKNLNAFFRWNPCWQKYHGIMLTKKKTFYEIFWNLNFINLTCVIHVFNAFI